MRGMGSATGRRRAGNIETADRGDVCRQQPMSCDLFVWGGAHRATELALWPRCSVTSHLHTPRSSCDHLD